MDARRPESGAIGLDAGLVNRPDDCLPTLELENALDRRLSIPGTTSPSSDCCSSASSSLSTASTTAVALCGPIPSPSPVTRLNLLPASACGTVLECTTLGRLPPAGMTGTVLVELVRRKLGVNPGGASPPRGCSSATRRRMAGDTASNGYSKAPSSAVGVPIRSPEGSFM